METDSLCIRTFYTFLPHARSKNCLQLSLYCGIVTYNWVEDTSACLTTVMYLPYRCSGALMCFWLRCCSSYNIVWVTICVLLHCSASDVLCRQLLRPHPRCVSVLSCMSWSPDRPQACTHIGLEKRWRGSTWTLLSEFVGSGRLRNLLKDFLPLCL